MDTHENITDEDICNQVAFSIFKRYPNFHY